MARDRQSRVKSIEQSIADTDEPDSKLRKELGALDLVVFGVAVAVGAGIFTLTARAAGDVAGPSVSLAFVLAVLACAWLMLNLSVETWPRFVVWMAIGFVVSYGYGRRHSRYAAGSAERSRSR
jgi:amino acid transporter